MPADRGKTPSTPSKSKSKNKSSSDGPESPSKGVWSSGDKSLLFDHVINFGQTDWEKAVPGKTAQQVGVVFTLSQNRYD
uniref:Myb-like domain-containing protein n=1 Tax=Kwoniella dejecticola CBS 10117 TaxID=1296121 RepID=A0A1A6ABV9_9TREE|nr:uncharacterized protein I303_01752 [Kwoniella dejecticola CBS 10117]OBR87544.1 hypothetical protein I303_01752 [Kwoniella dejecticola CBS 10117]